MYFKLPKLTDTDLDTLLTIADNVPYKKSYSHRRRMGENLYNNLSEYEYSKWYDWNRHQRRAYISVYPELVQKQTLVGHVLVIPPVTGLLDRQTTWVGAKRAGTMVSYALQDQVVLLNDEEVEVLKGEGVTFPLTTIHEIKPSESGQRWACLMTLGCPSKYI